MKKGIKKEEVKKGLKEFKPSYEVIEAAKCVFMAMAYTGTIRPRIEKMQNELLKVRKFEPCQKWKDRGLIDLPEVITDWKHTYLINDEDSKILYADMDREIKKMGFNVPGPGYCPLLIAEDMERKTKRLLIDLIKPVTGFDTNGILCTKNGLENYRQAVELTLMLLAPYCKDIKI